MRTTSSILATVCTVITLVNGSVDASVHAASAAAQWPYKPFTTRGRDILDSRGKNVVYAGVNWPGAGETMLPEGLQYNSVANITGLVKSLGMNSIRLTYATEMVDDHYAKSPNQTLKNTLVNALGQQNGTKILNRILANNPRFTAGTTRLQVFDAVVAECAKQRIYVHLDNHVSKAQWCCTPVDGNSWWGDTYFNPPNWFRGHQFMANRAKLWTALTSMSLRNELRPALQLPGSLTAEPYNFKTWYNNMILAAETIYRNNSSPLIFFGGINGDQNLVQVTQKQDLGGGTVFNPASYDFKNKIVYELHYYPLTPMTCAQGENYLYNSGYGAMNLSDTKFPNHAPMVLTEYSFNMQDGSYLNPNLAQCVPAFTERQPGGPGGLMQWVLAGSYYTRQGTQDYDETYGFLTHDWQSFRNQTVIQNYVKSWVKATATHA